VEAVDVAARHLVFKLFGVANGVQGAWHVLRVTGEQTATVALVVIGRNSNQCDVVLSHWMVSRRHAPLSVTEDNNLQIEDLASTNGTSIDGRSIESGAVHALQNGNRIKLGDVELVRHFDYWRPRKRAMLRGNVRNWFDGQSLLIDGTAPSRRRIAARPCTTLIVFGLVPAQRLAVPS
jgi:hypothetical protein